MSFHFQAAPIDRGFRAPPQSPMGCPESETAPAWAHSSQCAYQRNSFDSPLERNAHKPFSLCGYSFQNGLEIQRDGSSFGPGSSNRGGERPVGSGFQRRRRCLGRKNPMKPEVSWHTTLFAKSSVLYLWRAWVAERGCSGQEQALSVTGGARGISNPPQRCIPRHFGNAIVFCFGRSSRSELRISSMALFANL